jgi:hypothetical protein
MLGKLVYYPLEVTRTLMTMSGVKGLALANAYPDWQTCLADVYAKVVCSF